MSQTLAASSGAQTRSRTARRATDHSRAAGRTAHRRTASGSTAYGSTAYGSTGYGSTAYGSTARATNPGMPARPGPRPGLRVVAVPVEDRSRPLFVLACAGLLVGGLLVLLLINISLATGSFRLDKLQTQSRLLGEQSQALTQDLAIQGSPQQLQAKAAALGMVPAGSVAFLRLSDGAVLGVAQPAPARAAPTVPTAAPSAPSTAAVDPAATPAR